MIPMLDAATVPGLATTVITVGPAVLGVMLALVAGLAWAVSATSEELRRVAARDWELRTNRPAPTGPSRLAA